MTIERAQSCTLQHNRLSWTRARPYGCCLSSSRDLLLSDFQVLKLFISQPIVIKLRPQIHDFCTVSGDYLLTNRIPKSRDSDTWRIEMKCTFPGQHSTTATNVAVVGLLVIFNFSRQFLFWPRDCF